MSCLDEENSPLLEVREGHTVGESLSADTDTFQHTIASQLVEHQAGINDTGLLVLIGDDATHKVRLGVEQGGHQTVQLLLLVAEGGYA